MSHRRRRRPTPERSRHGDSGKLRRGGGASRFGAGPWAGLWAVRGSEGLGGGASSSRTRPSKWRLALSSGFRFRGGRPGDDRVTVGPGAPPPASLLVLLPVLCLPWYASGALALLPSHVLSRDRRRRSHPLAPPPPRRPHCPVLEAPTRAHPPSHTLFQRHSSWNRSAGSPSGALCALHLNCVSPDICRLPLS